MNTLGAGDILDAVALGAYYTIALSLAAMVGGSVLGLVVMLARLSRQPAIASCGRLFVDIFQGTPLLIQLFLVFFGLPILGLELPAFVAASIAMSFFSAAFLGETWKGSVESIPVGQWEAGKALALGLPAQVVFIVLPQAIRTALAPTVGFLVQIIKGTSLTSIIGFPELSRTGVNLTNATFEPLLMYGIAAGVYFAFCAPLSTLSRYLEKRFSASQERLLL